MVICSGLMHPHHVAELLACTQRHVLNLIKSGDLVAFKVGKRSHRVSRESVIKFLEKNKVDPEVFYE